MKKNVVVFVSGKTCDKRVFWYARTVIMWWVFVFSRMGGLLFHGLFVFFFFFFFVLLARAGFVVFRFFGGGSLEKQNDGFVLTILATAAGSKSREFYITTRAVAYYSYSKHTVRDSS